jgi:catechol 2,3-dioxygenase-like lactoylglutathione lyase family enzyme
MSTLPIQVSACDHITLIVADLDATRDFYVTKLGMSETIRPDFDFPGAWFSTGTFMIHATLSDELSGYAGWGDRGVKRISRGHHFAFEVTNVDEILPRLRQLAIPVADGPRLRPDGFKQVYIYDPDRHLIELFSQPQTPSEKDG